MTTDQRTDGRGGFRLPWANRPAAPAAEAGDGDALGRIDPQTWTPDEATADATRVGAAPGLDDLDADGDAWSVAGWPGRKAAFDGEHGAPTNESARFPGMGADGATPDLLTRSAIDEWPAVDVARLRAMTSPGEASVTGPAPAWPSSDPPAGARGARATAPTAADEPAVDLARLFASRAAANAAASSASSAPAPVESAPAAAPDASVLAADEPAAAEPATAEPATAEPATAEPATAPTASGEPAAAEPAAATASGIASQTPGPSPERRPVQEARVMPATAASPVPVVEHAAPPPAAATGAMRPTKFMVDLTRAMQAAAQSARDESVARLSADARQRVEEIEQLATSDSAELRRRADEDLVETREWSKSEIARIKDEAERRVVDRKARLDDELAGHAESVRRRTELVRETVSAYESRLASFIERLLAEEDPTRIATLAQTLPDPPVLADIDSAADPDTAADAAADQAAAEAAAALQAAEIAAAEATARARMGMSTEAAEAAEAAAMDGLDGGAGAEAWFAAERGTPGERGNGAERGRDVRTELVVVGLSSVAGIAGFKRALSGIKGVRSVGVSAGQAGEFVFALSHPASLDVATALPALTAFATQVTGKRDGGLLVDATEPAAGE